VNGDGFPDIVTSGVSIFFGDGTGAFPRRLDYLDLSQSNIVLTDLDGDGRTDIVEAEGNPFMLWSVESVLFARSNGTFWGPPVSLIPASPLALLSADFNGDGIPDLASASSQAITILKGAGDGTFSPSFQFNFEANSFVEGALVGDFNGDGKPDVAVSTSNDLIEVFLGQGDGTLQSPLMTAAPQAAGPMAAGDFNGDGKLDLAAITSSGTVLIYLGKGDGTFTTPVAYATTPPAYAFAAGDFNGDGKLDLALLQEDSSTSVASLGVLLGKGDGTFSTGPTTALPGAPEPTVAVADLNRDGKLDLALPSSVGTSGETLVLLGRGDGSFQAPAVYPYGGTGVAVADLNGDHIPDLIVVGYIGAVETGYLLGNGDGTFQPEVPFVSPGAYYALALELPVVADFNGDGKPDVAGINGTNGTGIATFLNTSQPPPSLTVLSAASFLAGPVSPASLAAAFGKGLALETAAAGGPFPTSLGSTSVSVTDATGATQLAPLLYVSPEQINFVVPEGTAAGSATVTVSSTPLQIKHSAQVQLAPVAPSMFTLNAAGLAAATVLRVSAGGVQTVESVFTEQNGVPTAIPINLAPATDQVYLILYGTGIRNAAAGTVSVNIQGLNASVSEVGPQPEILGLDQIQVLIPPALAGTGEVSIVVTAAGVQANTVYVTVE